MPDVDWNVVPNSWSSNLKRLGANTVDHGY